MITVEQRLDTIEKKIDRLLRERRQNSTPTWVKVGLITKLTGWDHEGMRKARENGLVRFRKSNGGFLYHMESIPEQFLKKNEKP